MSDYLYNLLARSLCLVETAQPLLTSLFEPPRDFKPVDAPQSFAAAEELAPALDAKDERAQPASLINRERAAPAPALPAPALNSVSSINAPSVNEGHERPSSAKQAQEKSGDPLTSLNQSAKPVTTHEALLPGHQAPPARPEIKTPSMKTGDHAQVSAQTIRALEPSPGESSRPNLSNANAASLIRKESPTEAKAQINEPLRKHAPLPAQSTQTLSPVIESKVIERTVSRESAQTAAAIEITNVTEQRSETIIVKPQVSRFVEMQQPEALRTAQAEPVVQVTIGRIEVRAATAPQQRQSAPPKSRQQSSQSLEDYLRQRAQGGAKR